MKPESQVIKPCCYACKCCDLCIVVFCIVIITFCILSFIDKMLPWNLLSFWTVNFFKKNFLPFFHSAGNMITSLLTITLTQPYRTPVLNTIEHLFNRTTWIIFEIIRLYQAWKLLYVRLLQTLFQEKVKLSITYRFFLPISPPTQ